MGVWGLGRAAFAPARRAARLLDVGQAALARPCQQPCCSFLRPSIFQQPQGFSWTVHSSCQRPAPGLVLTPCRARPCPPVAGAAHTPSSKVLVPLSKGAAALPELHVTDSSEAMLSGRKPPFRLLVRAVRAGQALPNIRHCVSEGFVVATRRTRTAGKVRPRGRDRRWGCEEGKAGDEERGEQERGEGRGGGKGRGRGSARAAACQFGRVESEARRMSPRFCFFCASPTLAWMKWGRGGAAGCYPTP